MLLIKYSSSLSAESQEAELSELVDNVSCWWAECEMIIGKVTEMREDLCEELPLAGSVPYIKKQDDTIQVWNGVCVVELYMPVPPSNS